ncbi:probable LRR receptor-like serine/threonine-protein kinase At1g06840 isoform X2, partial [Fagus crenata]
MGVTTISNFTACYSDQIARIPLLTRAWNPNPRNLITNPEEVKALRTSKSSLMDPYKNLSSWDQGDPCTSNWRGVMCTKLEDGYLHVERLILLRMNLSGILSPELGRLSNLKILDFMWNNISGSIPREIGSITPLELLLLNGNKLTGPLPEELGYLPNLNRLQIDENQISGPLPTSFANLTSMKHFHMNNNSISGQIPPELSKLPNLLHLLIDNNNLSGNLPPEFSELPNLRILQLDNNNFNGTTIPASYSKISKLVKLSLRNCSLQGPIPDLSQISNLYYLDLSSNQLNGTLTEGGLSQNITTILLSHNNLTGPIPTNFAGLPHLQTLSFTNNLLNGSVPSSIWQNRTSNATEKLTVELQNNQLSNIAGNASLPPNVTCSTNTTSVCPAQGCPPPYEYSPTSPVACFCALPLFVGYRLKSPGFSDFPPFRDTFQENLTTHLKLFLYQLHIDSLAWEEGHRLRMDLKFFPVSDDVNSAQVFNDSEVQRIFSIFASWHIQNSDLFGPYELLGFYKDEGADSPSSGLSKGALAGLVLGTIVGAVTLSAVVTLLIMRMHVRKYIELSRRRH